MGRPSHSRALGIWLNGLRVGRWTLPGSGQMDLTYDASWVERGEARALSLSLPMNADGAPIKGDRVGWFFDNLLPDSTAIRHRIRDRFGVRSDRPFDLLEAIGRDCVGALQLLPDDQEPARITRIDVTPLRASDVEKRLLDATSKTRSLAEEEGDELRISIAGAQEKTALTWHEGKWCEPHHATPTTHIFKLPLGLVGGSQLDMRDSLENEWLCAELLRAYGMRVAESEVKTFGKTKALVVERFDRALHSSKRYWLRLPQEDMCQATGTPPAKKYESDGGPGLVPLSKVLAGSQTRESDLETLMRAQLLFWMLAATDGHAKNFSLHLLPETRYQLTPLYDVISLWPVAGSRANQIHPTKLKLAMAVRGTSKHYRVADIRRDHFETTARSCGLLPGAMTRIIDEAVERTPSVIEQVASTLPRAFPESVFAAITRGLTRSAKTLAQGA